VQDLGRHRVGLGVRRRWLGEPGRRASRPEIRSFRVPLGRRDEKKVQPTGNFFSAIARSAEGLKSRRFDGGRGASESREFDGL